MSTLKNNAKGRTAFMRCVLAAAPAILLATSAALADPCPEDVNDDGIVDINDLMQVLASWGDCPDPCPADIDEDGNVDRRDLAILLAAWGDCTRPGPDVITHTVTEIDNTDCQEAGYFLGGKTHHTFDLQVEVTETGNAWTTSLGHVVITDPRVWCFQHYSQFANGAPPASYMFQYFPSLEFDSYWCEPTVIGPGQAGTGDGLLGLEAWIENTDEVLATWYYAPPYEQTPYIRHTIARFTFATSSAGQPYVGVVPAGWGGEAPLAGTMDGDTTHRSDGPELFDWAFDILAGEVAMDEDVDNGEMIRLNPGGGSEVKVDEPLIEFTNTSGTDNAWVVATESNDDLYPDATRYYESLGTIIFASTSLDDGNSFMLVTIPFTAADLNGADPMEIDLAYYDADEERWFLAVRGNTQDSPGHDSPAGDRFAEEGTTIPDLSTDLGDFGVFWNPGDEVGFVWANVDHAGPFTAGFANCREADVNYSGEVDIDDIFDILCAWGPCDDCPEDVDGSGWVDIDDVFVTFNVWGPCP